jgi:hypothetical protein
LGIAGKLHMMLSSASKSMNHFEYHLLLGLYVIADVVQQAHDAVLLDLVALDQVAQLGGQHARVAVLAIAQQSPEAVCLSLRILKALDACGRALGRCCGAAMARGWAGVSAGESRMAGEEA